MPHYDYQCDVCEHVFEVFQGMNDPLIQECLQCKGKVRRLIGSGSGLIFKGSGFYITDYKNSKKNDAGISASTKNTDETAKPVKENKENKENKTPEKKVKQSE